MRTKFYNNSLDGKFIKNLLASTSIPYTTITRDSLVIPGHQYFYEDMVVEILPETEQVSEKKFSDSKFKNLRPYKFGEEITNLTTRFESNQDGYDSDTHRYLGDYLRAYRDLKHVDLMHLYNCYNNEYITNIDIVSTTDSRYHYLATGQITDSQFVAIPIRLNKKYYIALDNPTPVEIICGIIYEKGVIVPESIKNESAVPYIFTGTYKLYPSMSFHEPVVYDATSNNSTYSSRDRIAAADFEKNLYMIIKLPKTQEGAIVVLEGDYSWVPVQRLTADGSFAFAPDVIDNIQNIEKPQLSPLSLLKLDDLVSYPFSPRLIEYLLLNVIDGDDEIDNNIIETQNTLKKLLPTNVMSEWQAKYYMQGLWDDYMSKIIFDISTNFNRLFNKYDLNGLLDKDAEYALYERVTEKEKENKA